MKWEFELDLNTDGGLELSNQLKEKEIIKEFYITSMGVALCCNYPLLNKQSSKGNVKTAPGYIIADGDSFLYIMFKEYDTDFLNCQKIGQVINVEGFSGENIKDLDNDGQISLVLAYERIEQPETKIAEINKKIITIIIGGLIILIILLIIKFIFK